MSDKAVIEATLNALDAPGLETAREAHLRNAKPPKIVQLTPPLVSQVLALIKTGMAVRDIQLTVISPGPQGQKWKLSRAQIHAIADARQARYSELTAPEVEPEA